MTYDYRNKRKKYMFRQARLEESGGKCEICHEPHYNLHIDHNKTTGEMRGLLCPRHNAGIGMFHDSLVELSAAARYLEKHGTTSYKQETQTYQQAAEKRAASFARRESAANLAYRESIVVRVLSGGYKTMSDVAREVAAETGRTLGASKVFVTRVLKTHKSCYSNKSNADSELP